jgi:hypothetical protein
MISWIIASHRAEILNRILLPSLDHVTDLGDELVIVRDSRSITEAYHAGQQLAVHPVHVYVHHDVKITNLPVLREQLIEHTQAYGIVGVVGSRTPTLPWWVGPVLGSVVDSRLGTINFGPGDVCSVVDGLLMATRHIVDWAPDAPGWHGYDHDVCLQLLAQGMTNFCLTSGHQLVEHHATSPVSVDHLTGWHEATSWYTDRWSRFSEQIASHGS